MATDFVSSTVASAQAATATQYNNLRKDVLQNAGDYATTTGGTNAYVLAVDSQIAAYAAGQVFKFTASFSNTGSATLNVNSIGAITIKKNVTENLDANDIITGQICSVVYDTNGNFQIISTPPVNKLQKSYTAGQAITAGQSVALSDGTKTASISQTSSNAQQSFSGTNEIAQTFTVPIVKSITSVTLSMHNGRGDSISGSFVYIYSVSAGVPNTLLATKGFTFSASSDSVFTVTLDTPLVISPNVTYAIVVAAPGLGGTLNLYYQNTDVYAGGNMLTSSNSGSTWTNQATYDLYFVLNYNKTTAGNIYLTDATSNDELANNFIGFANQAIAQGSAGFINIDGEDNNQSSLTIGKTYYLSNTPGAIASSAGSQSRKIGLSTSATSILIKHDNS